MQQTITLALAIGVFIGTYGTEALAQQYRRNAELVPTCNEQAGFATAGLVGGGLITITCPQPDLRLYDSPTQIPGDPFNHGRGYVETDGAENDYSQYGQVPN